MEVEFLPETPPLFHRCDANDDGNADLSDVIAILNRLFRGGRLVSCIAAADCNDDGKQDLSDAVFLFSYRFIGGDAPPAPYPDYGHDPTGEPFPCESYLSCP